MKKLVLGALALAVVAMAGVAAVNLNGSTVEVAPGVRTWADAGVRTWA